jgi:HSP20 family protein
MTLIKSNTNLVPFGFNDFFNDEDFLNSRWLKKQFKQTIPAVNVKENEHEFHIEFASPEFTKKDFKIDLEENGLTISAEKEKETNEEKDNFTRKEFSYNSFSRSFMLPKNVNVDKINATYNDGILNLSIPKMEDTKLLPKKEIKVV